jgi:nucleoid DNA-binding protein
MANAELKTKPTKEAVEAFLNKVSDTQKREDCFTVMNLMEQITKEKANMWGPSIVGFGNYHYKYESGREGGFFITGFSPRAQNLTLYIMAGFDKYDELMKKLGKFKTGKSCLYIKKLGDIDQKILKQLIAESVKYMKKTYPTSK